MNIEQLIIEWLQTQEFFAKIKFIWIYGSRSYKHIKNSDLDVLVIISNHNTSPQKISIILGDNIITSINIIEEFHLTDQDATQNHGFYFIGKLLGPKKLIYGKSNSSSILLSTAFSKMIYPWAFYMNIDNKNSFYIEEIQTLLFLLQIKINFCYLNYIKKYFDDQIWENIWGENHRIIKNSLPMIGQMEGISINGNSVTMNNDLGLNLIKKVCMVNFLSSCFWQFNYLYRNCDSSFIHNYYRVNSKNMHDLKEYLYVIDKLKESLNFKTLNII